MFTSGTSQCEVPDFMLVLCLPQILHSVKYLILCSFYVYLYYHHNYHRHHDYYHYYHYYYHYHYH